jgi:hypothetical protein
MSAIIKFPAPVDLLFPPARKESVFAELEPEPIVPGSIHAPGEVGSDAPSERWGIALA